MSASRDKSKTLNKTGTTLSLSEAKSDRSSHFIFQPKKAYMLAPFLDAKSIALLSACSRSLKENTKKISYWKDKLIALEDEDEIKTVISANVIQNYKNLYRNLHYTKFDIQKYILAWEIICLSGETLAMQHFLQQKKLTVSIKGSFNKTPLHWAAQSGSEKAMQWVTKTLRVPTLSISSNGFNALHCAALSGSVAAMKYAIEILGIPASSISDNGANALHCAAGSGSVAAMKYAIEILGISASSISNDYPSVLHHVAASGSVAAMKYAIEILEIPASSISKDGLNALHYAAQSGSVAAMKYAIEILKIPASSISNNGSNALHYAAQSGSVVAMKYAIEILEIPASSISNDGLNALHYAAWSGFVNTIKYAFEILKIPATSTSTYNRNALHYAANSGSIKALKYAFETLQIPAESTMSNGINAWHCAAWSGSIPTMEYALETLQIPATSTTNYGRNALHIVSRRSVTAVRHLRILNYKLNLGLEPTTSDTSGHDAFWYANQSNNSDAIKEILSLPIDRIINPPDPYENYWRTAKVASSLIAGAAIGYLQGTHMASTAITVYGISAATFIGACTITGAGLLLLIAYGINCYRTGYSGFFSSVLTRNEQSEMKQEERFNLLA